MADVEIWEDLNQPPTGMVNAAEGGVIWKRPDGSVIRVTREGFFQLTPEQAAPYLAPTPMPAAEQAGAIETAAPAAPVTAQEASRTQVGPVRTGAGYGQRLKAEQKRAEAEKAVQMQAARERAAAEGPLGGLSLGERAKAAELVRTGQAKTEEEAAKLIMASRPTAAEQAGAIE